MNAKALALVAILLSPSLCAGRDVPLADPGWFLQGNRSLSSREILDHLAARDIDLGEGALSQEELERAVRLVRQFYQDRGYPLARVELMQPPGQRLRIDEGPQAELGTVDIQGNTAFCSQELEDLLGLGRRMDFDQLEAGLEKILRAYRNAGFVLAEAEQSGLQVFEEEVTRHFPLPFQQVARNRIRLQISIEEGPRFQFGSTSLPPALSGLDISFPAAGEVYDESRILDYRNQVGRRFASQGRIIREFQILQRMDEPSRRVDLRIEFSLLPPLDVGRVEFEGNSRYPDSFYRRELTFDEGDLLDPRELARSLAAINSTGVLKHPLSEKDVELSVDLQSSTADVLIPLQEKKRRRLLYSLARTDLGEINAGIALSIANWLGLGETLGLELEYGGGGTGAALSLASRYLLGTDLPVSLGLRFFRRSTGLKLAGVDGKLQDIFHSRRIGFSGTASYRIRRRNQAGLRFTVEEFTRPEQTGHLVLEPFWARSQTGSGFWARQFQVGGRLSLFSDPSQAWNWRPFFDYRQIGQESPSAPKFTFRLQGAYSRFSSGQQLLSERLFADSELIRGFAATTTGPWGREGDRLLPLGGDAYLALNTEYEFSPRPFFSLAPFLDTGVNLALASPQGFELLQETSRVWRASLGGELRIRLPGPLPTARLVAAWNPLRLDRQILTARGLARLRDPKAVLRFTVLPRIEED